MVQFVHLLIQSKAIARWLGDSITDALRTIEAGSIESRRRFLRGALIYPGETGHQPDCTSQHASA
jgi:hypothetical protein